MTDPARTDGFLPLSEYALLGDGRSCALVASDGAVDWWALPQLDSAPAFGALLDPDRGGRLTVRPSAPFTTTRHYAEDGAVLVTEFRTAAGTARLTDSLNLGAGSLLPWTELARRIETVEGEVALDWEVAPGTRFGSTAAWARTSDDVPVITLGELQLAVVLDGPGGCTEIGGGFRGRFVLRAGESALLAVIATNDGPIPVPGPTAIRRRVDETSAHWAGWRELVDYSGPWRDAVVRSAIVHKQLTLATSGGLQAAATTSLPERVGAGRNFDYRFSWIRDTGFALDALTRIGLRGEVHAALSFLLRAVARTAPTLQVFYTIDGDPAAADIEQVPLWRGYRDSRPVQIGNGAATQRQLGAYGDLLQAISRYCHDGNLLDGAAGRLVAQLADEVCAQWTEDDAGLWELGQQRPYTSSKIGVWAALDRAAELAAAGQVPDEQATHWRDCAEQVRAYINEECWSPDKNAYTFYAGTDELDCATLLVARTGFSAGDDPRLHGTIDAVRAELSAGGPLLYRYTGMREEEGAFVACSFWLVEALAIAGRVGEARQLMDEMVQRANDVGLFGEEVDPGSGEPLGNLPQTLSHLALISAAVTCAEALSRA